MNIYYDKIKFFRKKQKISIIDICDRIGICRSTYWRWEKNVLSPSESEIRSIAELLKVEVTEISNITPHTDFTDADVTASSKAWLGLVSNNNRVYNDKISDIIMKMHDLNSSFNNIMLFVNALLKTTNIAFYAKDNSLKYIMANAAFLKTLSLNKNYNVLNKTDNDFFNKKEAKENTKQDNWVIKSNTAINSHEHYIPGTKKKMWGLFFKTPIFDYKGKALGMIAFIIDITEKKKNEEIRLILEQSINSLDLAVSIIDFSKEKYYFLNDTIESIFGINTETLKSWTREEKNKYIIYKEDIDLVNKHFNNPSETENEFVFRIIRPDNKKLRWLKAHYSTLIYFGKKCRLTIFNDITEKKKLINDNLIIAEKLKTAGVDTTIISNATGIKIKEVEKL